MKVFISWSGAASQKVAIALRDWLPSVIQAIIPFVSSEDIDRGARWFSDIGVELETTAFGILCITPHNIQAPWILYEAGALSKSLGQSRVIPLLIGVRYSDLGGPLAQFNATSIAKQDMTKLLMTLNKQFGDQSLPDEKVERAFEKWWPDLEPILLDAVSEVSLDLPKIAENRRPQNEVLEEILDLVRRTARDVAKSQNVLKLVVSDNSSILAHGAEGTLPEFIKQEYITYSPKVFWAKVLDKQENNASRDADNNGE